VLLYDRTSNNMTVSEARKQLFSKNDRQMQDIPPGQAALLQHVERATFHSGYCWYMALQAQQKLPWPSEWGWARSTGSEGYLAAILDHTTGRSTLLPGIAQMQLQEGV
jgi:hypothetical protein